MHAHDDGASHPPFAGAAKRRDGGHYFHRRPGELDYLGAGRDDSPNGKLHRRQPDGVGAVEGISILLVPVAGLELHLYDAWRGELFYTIKPFLNPASIEPL